MANTIPRAMKFNPWLKGLLLLSLIPLAIWLDRSNHYTFTPDTRFTTITGQQLSLKALQGKPVLITFWATTCPSCVHEIPRLIALYDRYHPQGFEIIAIAMTYDPPNRVVAMAQELKLPYPVVLDIKADYSNAFGKIWATPTTLLINPKGMVSKRVTGPFEIDEMQKRIELSLNENGKPL